MAKETSPSDSSLPLQEVLEAGFVTLHGHGQRHWLSWAELQILPDTKRFSIAGRVYIAGFHPDRLAAMESSKFPFHPHAQRNAFRRDARLQSRLFVGINR
jgi:hypothetical protein